MQVDAAIIYSNALKSLSSQLAAIGTPETIVPIMLLLIYTVRTQLLPGLGKKADWSRVPRVIGRDQCYISRGWRRCRTRVAQELFTTSL